MRPDKNWVIQKIPARYLSALKLRRALDMFFPDGDYSVDIRGDTYLVRSAVPLPDDAFDIIRDLSDYHFVAQQNQAISTLRDRETRNIRPSSPQAILPTTSTSKKSTEPGRPNRLGKWKNSEKSSKFAAGDDGLDSSQDHIVDTDSIPLFDPAIQASLPINTGLKSGNQFFIEMEQSDIDYQSGRLSSGLYSAQLEAGETSKVFDVRAHMISFSDDVSTTKVLQKCAIKRLNSTTRPERFWAEYASLKRLNTINHPHVVETLSVFRHEEDGIQYFNFLFPLAWGNLKRLFRGRYDENKSMQKRSQTHLWRQFVGLASAVAYLHDDVRTAHRDIKPSNILIYESAGGDDLILKLTDFGLAVDLSNDLSWEYGSLALKSAWAYDAPELRRTSPNPTSSSSDEEKIGIPTVQELLSNDIWKLGCVFTEMIAFLVDGGSAGVSKFRDYITTTEGQISSDLFNDTRFDDGENVKPRVLQWFDIISVKDERAKRLSPLLQRMLAKSVLRPTIQKICEELIEMNYPGISYGDGLRIVRFTPAYQATPPTRLDSIRLGIESRIGHRIDWSPFPRPRLALGPNDTMMSWEWGGREISLLLSQDEMDRYKPICLPVVGNHVPLLPLSNSSAGMRNSRQTGSAAPINTSAHAQSLGTQSLQGTSTPFGASGRPPSTSPPSGPIKDIYWCVEKAFTEPKEICLFPVLNSGALKDDEELYHQVRRAIQSSGGKSFKGWLLRKLSWKRCTEIEFVKFCVVWKNRDQVSPLEITLPPDTAREYSHSVRDPVDVQMRAAAAQMVFGLMHPSKARGQKTMIDMLPKKINPPPFAKDMGAVGWGLHAKMGFSQRRFLGWLLVCFVGSGVFVGLWLHYISHTDLQNAFVPATILTGTIGFGFYMLQ